MSGKRYRGMIFFRMIVNGIMIMLSGLFKKQPDQGKQNWVSYKIKTAIETDDFTTFNLYLTANSSDAAAINASTIHGETILMLTIRSRNTRLMIKAAQQKLVDVNAVAKNGDCAITLAMSYDDSVTVEYLLDNKNLDLSQHGPALFIWAVKKGFENIVRRLANHPWFIAYLKNNPEFSDSLLEAALSEHKWKILLCLIELKLVDVNKAAAAFNVYACENSFKQALDAEQDFVKAVLSHPESDFKWLNFLAENSASFLILTKLQPADIRFLLAHPAIRVIHTNFTVFNPAGYKEKSVYMDKLFLTLANPDNSVCNMDHLLNILLLCPTFNRDMVIWEDKTTNDLLRESTLTEPAAVAANNNNSDDDASEEDDDSTLVCRVI